MSVSQWTLVPSLPPVLPAPCLRTIQTRWHLCTMLMEHVQSPSSQQPVLALPLRSLAWGLFLALLLM